MALFKDMERRCADALVSLGYCNPFLPERITYEREILGKAFVGAEDVWYKDVRDEESRPNLELLTRRAKELADLGRTRLISGQASGDEETALYADIVLYYFFNNYSESFIQYANDAEQGNTSQTAIASIFDRFRKDTAAYLNIPGISFSQEEAGHIFACFFQLRRAWQNIFENIIGGSAASVRLRAAVWQSIFTSDMRRYRRALYQRMGDITTLVAGPSGTGKELVARAIGLSRYIPFDPKKKQFTIDFSQCFFPINLSALSPTIIESELFGHKKGSFTGAVADRIGFLELCPREGAVFLDEIGEIEPAIQVKLLRVLESRIFQPIGEFRNHRFTGKVIAATNRNLEKEMEAGRFRQDLYYRLCSDIITTPSLREQIEGASGQLQHNLVLFLARRVAGTEEAESLAQEVEEWIQQNIPSDYTWPGNVRELEQCVRNIMIRKAYQPYVAAATNTRDKFIENVRGFRLTAEELLRYYTTLIYAETGSYQETARRLQLDRRTVKERIDDCILASLQE